MKNILLLLPFIFFDQLNGQIITTIAGNGIAGFGGDSGQATAAELNNPTQAIVDALGNVYISDLNNNRIRKINTSGIITTVAGVGTASFSGDGGEATAAELNSPEGIALDTSGNLYIADWGNNRIRLVNTLGIINTIAGGSFGGFGGDGGQATAAFLNGPSAIAIDSSGNIYFTDESNYRVRKINNSGIITTVAGNGTYGFSGDGGQATAAALKIPSDIALDAASNLYIADYGNFRIRKVNSLGVIKTIAGGGNCGSSFCGDGGQATAAELWESGVILDAINNIYIADEKNNLIRKVDTSGIINTIAGTGSIGFSGDGGLATSAQLYYPTKLALDVLGNLYVADFKNNRIRKITNVAGINQEKNKIESISVYPNPSYGNITISSQQIMDEIEIRDILGQLNYIYKPHSRKFNLQIENNGVYFVTVTSGNKSTVKRLIVQH